MIKKIIFDKTFKNFILEGFDKTVDKEGFIVEKSNPNQRVLTPDGSEIKAQEFAGIRKGSTIFIRSDLPSLIELCDELSH